MRKLFSFVITALGVTTAKAESLNDHKVDEIKKDNIETAVEILIEEGVIVKSEDEHLIINESLLEKLRTEGKIIKSNKSVAESICVVPQP